MNTSSPNTEAAPKRPDLASAAQPAAPKDAALAALEQELTQVKDRLREERFVWILAVVILGDILLLDDSEAEWLPILVLALQLPLLLILANRLGVQEIARILSRVLDGVIARKDK